MLRLFWQILIDLAKPISRLTCEECFAVLNYNADQLEAGADPEKMNRAVIQHLARCPECHVEMQNWIEELKAQHSIREFPTRGRMLVY